MLTKRPDESVTEFTIRRMRAEIMEEAAQIVEAIIVPTDHPPGPADASYSLALVVAAHAIRSAADK